MSLGIEIRKIRRSGVVPTMLATGVLGSLYAVVVFALRKESMLALPLPPMDILLTQLYGVIIMINLCGIIISCCLIFDIEYQGNASRRMKTLPISMGKVYASKYLIISSLTAVSILLQSAAFAYTGRTHLPPGSFEPMTLAAYMLYCYVLALPVVSIMLLISSKSENIWVSLGIGVAGFVSGLTASLVQLPVFLANPFALIMKPALSTAAAADNTAVIFAVIETGILFAAGIITEKHSRHE